MISDRRLAMNQNKDLQDETETCYDVWSVDGGSDKKTVGRAEVEDVKMFTGSDQDGQD